MHEFALADAVMRAAGRTAASEQLSRVTRVRVLVGELQQIDPEVFSFALSEVRPTDDPRLRDMRLDVEVVPVRFCCRACGHAFALADAGQRDAHAVEAIHLVPEVAHAFLRCPACRSPDFEVTEGRGVVIASIEGEP